MITLRELARALGGEITSGKVLCSGPGHSRADRSLQIVLDPGMPGGFAVHSYAGDDFRDCRDYVRRALGLSPFKPGDDHNEWTRPDRASRLKTVDLSARAMEIWHGAAHPSGTLVETYLRSRKLELPPAGGDVIRFAEKCFFGKERYPAMVAAVRNVQTNELTGGIHRTALRPDATEVRINGKTLRKSLGPTAGGCIKLFDDADIDVRLTICEGIESALSAAVKGYPPVWAALSSNGIKYFPVLPGIETIFLHQEHDETSAKAITKCACRWFEANRAVQIIESECGNDLNDELKECA